MDLMFGCLGNGVTVWDRSRTEHGDYKTVCHISDKGEIKFYCRTELFSAEEMARITDCAEREQAKYKAWFFSLPLAKKYEVFLDDLSTHDLLSFLEKKKINGWTVEQALSAYGVL